MMSADKQADALQADIVTDSEVSAIDVVNKTVTYQDTTVAYRDLVLALGGEAIVPRLDGDAVSNVMSINSLMDYRACYPAIKQAKKVVILGAGLVGVEMANDMQALDIQVHCVDLNTTPLASCLPSPLGDVMKTAFEQVGVLWHLGCSGVAVNHAESGYQVTLSDDTTLQADVVIAAIGIRPHVALAQQAGLNVDRAILVNALGQTSAPHVYALGDCAAVMGQWRPHIMPIAHCAKAIAKNLAGDKAHIQYPVMPIIAKTPLCPMVAVLPQDKQGEWRYEHDEAAHRGLLYSNDQLVGFALLGDAAKEHTQWSSQLAMNVT